MKEVKNQQSNSLRFILSNEDTTLINKVRLRQLGSSRIYSFGATTSLLDCFTITINFNVGTNKLFNGNYILTVEDSNNNIIFYTNVLVTGNIDTVSGYIIIDDDSIILDIKLETFDNSFGDSFD